ncbi:MBL fold metallo-hydrolase [Antribacter sp. KLBMP9083]|uniref:MBL fold metallo-hydrolase n=1 Tax=Antribacter soli TaxID=2910976 RepID=A0AA41U759_9MICO|nr:MBL fold metallo-hydrolase [Antribacter soli]MCF4121201.1 MBL fold metallo-hydrolase [Antribacter soli]
MTRRDLDVHWIHGTPRRGGAADPPLQVHHHGPDTVILRQSRSVTFEAPFLYLLFGADRAFLLDTGATQDPATFPLRETVDRLVEEWLAEHPHAGYELVVAHTHSHRDHVAGDAQLAGRERTMVVGTSLADVQAYFGFTVWPTEVVTLDLGGRLLEITGIPGHHPASIAVFDPRTGFLLTGDTVYPGRLYGMDMPAFVASMDHLVEFADARPVTHVMGCHIEMSRTPGRDYPAGTRYQPDEAPLPMTPRQLHAVRDAAHAAAGQPGMHVHSDFVVYNGTGRLALLSLLAHQLRGRFLPWSRPRLG